jgi:hypothetical protein
MIAREGRLHARLRRQVRGGVGDRLDTGLLVIGDDRHRVARLLFGGGRDPARLGVNVSGRARAKSR